MYKITHITITRSIHLKHETNEKITWPDKYKTFSFLAGNPRNKVALRPGYSLMDWIKLTKSGKDLAGTGGKLLQVSPAELARHKYRKDAWMAINGIGNVQFSLTSWQFCPLDGVLIIASKNFTFTKIMKKFVKLCLHSIYTLQNICLHLSAVYLLFC